jgi:hypothetical protein
LGEFGKKRWWPVFFFHIPNTPIHWTT